MIHGPLARALALSAFLPTFVPVAGAEEGMSVARHVGNATAFEDAPTTYLHCFVVMTSMETLSDSVAPYEDGLVKSAFGVSKATLKDWSTEAARYTNYYSQRLKTLDPTLPPEEQLAYAESVQTLVREDLRSFIHARDRQQCIDFADREG